MFLLFSDSGDWRITHKKLLTQTYFTLLFNTFLPADRVDLLTHSLLVVAVWVLCFHTLLFAVLLYYKEFYFYLRFAPSFHILHLNRWIGRHARRQRPNNNNMSWLTIHEHQHKKQQTENEKKIKLFINRM